MVKYELLMLRSTFRLNLRKPTYLLSYAALLFACLFVGYCFALAPEYFLLVGYSQVLTEWEAVALDMLTLLFAILLLYTVLRAVFDQGLRTYVGQADFSILVSTPVDSRCIIMAKCVRSLISRTFLVILTFLAITPVSLKLGTSPLLLAATLVSFALYIETLQATSFAVHSARDFLRSRLSSRTKQLVKITALTVSTLTALAVLSSSYYAIGPWTSALGEGAEALWTLLPSSLAASLVLGFMLGRPEVAYPSLLCLSGFLVGALAFVYVASGPRHPEEFAPHPFPSGLRSPLGFRIGGFLERRLNWEKHTFVVFFKDIQLALRGAVIDFSLLDFTMMYAVPLVVWYLLETFLPFQVMPDFEAKLGPLKVFVKELVIILALLPFIPSLTSFSREMAKIWILKVFPFQNCAVAYGKFLFALVISAASLAPMVLVAGLALDIAASEWMVGAALPLILLIASSLGVLVGAYLPPYDLDNHMSLKSLITFYFFLAFLLTPFTLVTSVQGIIAQVLLLALLGVYSVASTMFFLKQAGKGFGKLELREVLPNKARTNDRE